MNALRIPSACPPTSKRHRPCKECRHVNIYVKDDSWGYCRELDVEIDANHVRRCKHFEPKE
jgi:hypothetical protein